MSNLDPQQIININSLRSSINSAHDLVINQKANLVKNLSDKKHTLIDSVQDSLRNCKNSGDTMYNQWINTNNKDAHNILETYHENLKRHHDEGSELIGQINAANNFEQLNKIQTEQLNSFLIEVRNLCGSYVTSTPTPVRYVQPSPVTVVRPAPVTVVRPAPVRYVQPAPVTVVRPAPVRYVQPAPVTVVRPAPVTVVRPTPVTVVRPAPVRYVQPAPVTVVRPAPKSKTIIIRKPQKVIPVKPVIVKSPRARKIVVSSVNPMGIQRAKVTHDYTSSAPGTITLPKNTIVNIQDYHGDWAMVETANGHRGYASRFYLQPL